MVNAEPSSELYHIWAELQSLSWGTSHTARTPFGDFTVTHGVQNSDHLSNLDQFWMLWGVPFQTHGIMAHVFSEKKK